MWVLGVSQAYFRVSGSSLHLCYRSKTIVISFFDFNGINFLNSCTRVVSHIKSRLIMQYMIIWICP